MDVWITVVVVVVLLPVAVAVYLRSRSRRSSTGQHLERRSGSGHDRVVERASDRGETEQEVEHRVERHERPDVAELSPEQRERYAEQWLDIQRRFVDDPEGTLGDADRLITQAMRERGHPTEDHDREVDHAGMLDAYRAAHQIADRHERGGASTDDLRRAMQHYRTVFEDIVETRTTRWSGQA